MVPTTTVITRWFHRRRSVALSVASTGLSVGGILLTPAAKRLLDEQGLEAGTPWLGLVFVLGTVPFALWLVRPDPESAGWLPDGERSSHDSPPPVAYGTAYADAVRTRFFVAVTFGYLLVLGSQVGAIQQLVRLAEERTDKSTASFVVLFLAGTSVIARLVGGRVVARVPMAGFTVTLAALQSVAMVAIALSESRAALFAAIIVFGTTVGNILMLQPLLIAERFGVVDYPRIFSRSQFIMMFGTALGPLVLGWLHDNAGGYQTSYLVAAGCSLAGAAVLASGGAATMVDDRRVQLVI
jgi:predicted MFS family arabinose efflux permease